YEDECTARSLCTIESFNGACCRVAVRHLDEAKAAGAAGLAVGHNPNRVDGTIRLEELTQVLLRGGKSQVAHKDMHAEFSREKGAPEARVHTGAPASAPSPDTIRRSHSKEVPDRRCEAQCQKT